MSKKKKLPSIRNVATPKQTGGGGFVFEDKVAGWFCAHFLQDSLFLNSDVGKITRIDFQVRPEGWLFDDLLLTSNNSTHQVCKVAVSVKSNVQFNNSGPKVELLYDLWNQYVGEPTKVFDPLRDYLCIVNSPIPAAVSTELVSLLASAKAMDPKVFLQRISEDYGGFSIAKKQLFGNFHCPVDIASKYNITHEDTVLLLSRLFFLEFDFESSSSKSENAIIAMARNVLVQPDGQKEILLYESLCTIGSEFASVAGYLDYEHLIKRFRYKFDLKGYSNHESDWAKMHDISSVNRSAVRDSIGNKLCLSRNDELDLLKNEIDNNQVVFVLGKSGHGKSALVKKLVDRETVMWNNYIWIDSQSITSGTLLQYFGLQHSISDLFKYSQKSLSYLIIDGVDRFFKEEQLMVLFEIVKAATAPNSSWKVIFTCQNDDYSDVIERFYRINIPIISKNFEVILNVNTYFPEIQKIFPELSDLFKHTHLHSILNNLKYLDILAFKLSSGIKIPDVELIGETTIIDWIWKEGYDAAGSRFMQEYAKKQAESFSSFVPVTDFSISELLPLEQLKAGKSIYEKDDKLYLSHDLTGDWARYKFLRANEGSIKSYMLSLELGSPLWRKAIRLYGIYLLEKNDSAISWKAFMQSLSEMERKERIIQDIMLESIFFSPHPNRHLKLLFDYLKEEEGKLFKRFIGQFLIKGTTANQAVLNYVKENGIFTLAEASSIHRIPDFLYWPEVIQFLFENKKEVGTISGKQIAELCLMWLDYAPSGFPYREEISAIALENAQRTFDFTLNGGYLSSNEEEVIYKAFLAGVNEHLEDVIALALKLCKRVKAEKVTKPVDEHTISIIRSQSIAEFAKIRDKVQWPDGPFEDVDDAFEKVCLHQNALNPLILANPQVGLEIILALLIEAPKEVSFNYSSSNYNLDLKEPMQWSPPFYNKGPFSYFFAKHPNVALDLVIRLVNFATQQWTNDFIHNSQAVPTISMIYDGTTYSYTGDNRVYFWFRDVHANDGVVCALQALEKFLFDQINSKNPIENYLDTIFKSGTSTAFMGLLSSIGKYSPSLFLGPLKEMFTVIDFYIYEKDLDFGAYGVEGHQMVGSYNFDKTTLKLAEDWHGMGHRKKSIGALAVKLFLEDVGFRDFFKNITESWKSLLDSTNQILGINIYLKRLVSYLDMDNYDTYIQGDDVVFNYKEPKELTIELAKGRKNAKEDLDFFTFPLQCFRAIENGNKLNLEDCKNLWDKVQTAFNLQNEDQYDSFEGTHRAVLAGCALLFYNKEIWIEHYPQIEEWTISYLEQLLDGYKSNSYSLQQNEMPESWSASAARILAVAWADDLKNNRLRTLIAALVLKCPFNIIGILFQDVAKRMEWSENNFVQLQNFVILWAVGSDKKYYYSQPQYYTEKVPEKIGFLKKMIDGILGRRSTENKNNFDADKYIRQIVRDFSNNKTKTKLIDWSTIRDEKPKHHPDSPFQREDSGNHPGINKSLVKNAFVCLPALDKLSASDRKHVCQLWKQIVEQITFELGAVDDVNLNSSKYPSKFERWTLERISCLVLDVDSKDGLEADQLWKPIFAYGINAGKWITAFMEFYFMHNLEREDKMDILYNKWVSMIEFAENCQTWKPEKKYMVKDLEEALMSISDMLISRWKYNKYPVFFDKAAVEVMKWGNRRAYDQDSVYRILLVLKTNSGMKRIKEGIAVVNRHLKLRQLGDRKEPAKGYVKVQFKHADLLAGTASFLWENCKDQIKHDTELFAEFKEIVTYLVSRQNAIGLELQDQITK